jgi:hypothetical protein
VALTRELLKLLNAALGIVSTGYRFEVIADQLIETLVESLGFLSRELRGAHRSRGGPSWTHYMWTRMMCHSPSRIPFPNSCVVVTSLLAVCAALIWGIGGAGGLGTRGRRIGTYVTCSR